MRFFLCVPMRLVVVGVLAKFGLGCAHVATALETDMSLLQYDVLIVDGMVYDGSGASPSKADVGIRGDRIVAIGDLGEANASVIVDADGYAVAPGFINALSWSTSSLLVDGRAQSVVRQGVTTEIMGEGFSWGPFTDESAGQITSLFGEYEYDVNWRTLGEYFERLEKQGVSVNVGSFVGSATLRIHEAGYEDGPLTDNQYEKIKSLTAEAMREGALGLGSALMYVPDVFYTTDELVGLAEIVADYGGSYIAHMRDEGFALIESVEEMIEIAERASLPVEIYHLKAAGKENWGKVDQVIEMIESARASGLDVRANMYVYTAGSTGLDGAMPPWVQEGGIDAWVERLKNPDIRRRVAREMRTSTDDWSNTYLEAGSPENVVIVGAESDVLKPLLGKNLQQIADQWGVTPEEAAMDLVIKDRSRLQAVYFMMSEENVRKQISLPWVSFGSDGEAMATEGVFLKNSSHPRSYGNFARLLGKYVREENVISLAEAVRKLTSLPAANFNLKDRGWIRNGAYADIVVFDPDTIREVATFEKPHQYSLGVEHVFVNGAHVINEGDHTGATPGAILRGPGWIRRK